MCIRDRLAEAEVWAAYGFDIKEEDIERAGKLKWIMVYTAGVDALPAKPILERDILVTNEMCIRDSLSIEIATFDRGFYEREFEKHRVSQNTGIQGEELKDITEDLLSYLRGKRGDLEIYGLSLIHI